MLLAEMYEDAAANPLLPQGPEILMMVVALILFVGVPVLLVVSLVVFVVRRVRFVRTEAAATGELGAELSRRVDSIESRLSNVEKTLDEAGV